MKKLNKRFCLLLTTVFLLNILGVMPILSKSIVFADTVASNIVSPDRDFNILEVEPGISFDFNTTSFTSESFNGRPVKIRQMSMPEFIANVDVLNGKYDIIYVGNNQSTATYSSVGRKSNYLPQGGTNDGSDSLELYSENDITNKRASDLINFISSNQCIVFADSIFSDSTSNNTILANSFRSLLNTNSFKSLVTVTSQSIISLYNSIGVLHRPLMEVTSMPTQYPTYASDRLLNFVFDISNITNVDALITTKLYLDVNGDGLFADSECVKTIALKGSGTGKSIDYQMPTGFVGVMPWKLEVSTVSGSYIIKSYKIGTVGYLKDSQTTATLPIVRVLQIVPDGNNFSLINGLRATAPLVVNNEYNIRVTQIYVNDFNSVYTANPTNPSNVNGVVGNYDANNSFIGSSNSPVTTILNGNYDMIILGFNDVYGNNDLKDDASAAIKAFIKTGQSVMFTHDLLTSAVNSVGGWDYNTTKQFRDQIGQARYKDSYNNPSELNIDGTTHIPHVALPIYQGVTTSRSYGSTNPALDRADSGNFITYNSAHKLNDGVITEFPYTLGDINVATTHYQYFQLDLEDPNVIPWYTLDTGDSNKYDGRNYYYTYSKGNITYSGTGHSSPSGSADDNENKLFINTMMKASRSANHAPTLNIQNITEGQNFSKGQSSLDFSFVANDIDNDPLNGLIKVNNVNIPTSEMSITGAVTNVDPFTGTTSGATSLTNLNVSSTNQVNVSIPKATLIKYIPDSVSSFQVTVIVNDAKNAIATQTINLNYVNVPSLDITSNGNPYNVLPGDIFNVNLTATASAAADTNLNTTMSGANVLSSVSDPTGLTLNNNSFNFGSVVFNGKVSPFINPITQTRNLTVIANKPGNYLVSNAYSYGFNDLGTATASKNYDYTVNVVSSSVKVTVVDTKNDKIMIPVHVHIKKGDSVDTVVTTSDGIAQITNQGSGQSLSSGEYTVSILNSDLPSGYTTVNGKDIVNDVSLSYLNAKPELTLTIEGITPTIPLLTADIPNTSFTKGKVTVSVSYDPRSTVKQYSVDLGVNWIDYPEVGIVNASNSVVRARSQSGAGIWGPTGEYIVSNIDLIPPTVLLSVPAAFVKQAVITINTDDNLSGVKNINVSRAVNTGLSNIVSTSAVSAYGTNGKTERVTVNANGAYDFTVTDQVGNVTTQEIVVNTVDLEGPIITVTSSVPDNTNTDRPVVITISSVDIRSGTKEIDLPDGTKVTDPTPNDQNNYTTTFIAKRNQTYSFSALDNLGNSSTSIFTVANIRNER